MPKLTLEGCTVAGIELSDDDLWKLMDYCRTKLGIYPLSSLCRTDVLEVWRASWQDIPQLEDYVDEACDCVARHWEDEGLQIAWDIAVEHVQEWAARDGHEVKPQVFNDE